MVQGRKRPLHQGLPRRLKEARLAAGIPRTRLSMSAGLAQQTVPNLEAGVTPRLPMIERLAAVLGVSPCWLAFGHDGRHLFREKTPRAERGPAAPELAPGPADLAAPVGPGDSERPSLRCDGVGVRLQQARLAQGMTLKGLGRASQTSDTTVRLTEQGETVPSVATVEALARALRVSPCWLAFGTGAGPDAESS